jgi:alkylhydroperoxidase family enzyme
MSRIIGVIDPHPTHPLVQEAFTRDVSRVGRVMPATRAWGLVPEVYDAFSHMSDAVQKLNGVPAEVKALATLLTYMRVGCVACLDFGSGAARLQGVTEEKLMALQQYKTSPLFSESERAALRLAEAMTRAPARVTQEEFEALKQFYDEAQEMEIIIHIVAANMRARIGCALDLVPEGFSEGKFCVLPAQEQSAVTSSLP